MKFLKLYSKEAKDTDSVDLTLRSIRFLFRLHDPIPNFLTSGFGSDFKNNENIKISKIVNLFKFFFFLLFVKFLFV